MENTPLTRPLNERRRIARDDSSPEYLQRRDRILSAARKVFRDKGFHAASLKDIATECGTDRASVYYYFSDKDEIFREIVHEHVVSNVGRAEEIIRRPDLSAGDKLSALMIDLMEAFERTYPDLFIYIQQDMSQIQHEKSDWAVEMRDLARRYDRIVEGVIVEGMDSGEFSSDIPSRVVAYGIIGMLNWTHRWYNPDVSSSRDVGEALAQMTLKGLTVRRTDDGLSHP